VNERYARYVTIKCQKTAHFPGNMQSTTCVKWAIDHSGLGLT